MRQSDQPLGLASNEGLGVTITARPLEWEQDSGFQWTDRHCGFSIMEEPGDDLPFCAAWGEGDAEQFATLDEAKAWCQADMDRWIARHAVVQMREAGWVCADGFPALLGSKPLKPGTKLYADPAGWHDD